MKLFVLFLVLVFFQGDVLFHGNIDSNVFVAKKLDLSIVNNESSANIFLARKLYKIIPVGKKTYDVKDFGAKGNGKFDDTKAINIAIDFCSKNKAELLISSGIYLINCEDKETGVKIRSNTTLTFLPGSSFKSIPSKSKYYKILDIYNIQNVVINQPVLVGDKPKHMSSEGEWGYGINIENAVNITINNPKVTDMWGDGIYIGNRMYDNTQNYSTENIYIKNAYIDNCRRNGISICMGKNITIDHPVIKNISGTNPQSGIDFEPEWDRGVLPLVYDNIKVLNPITENCSGDGIQIFLNLLSDKNMSTNILIQNHEDTGSKTGITFYKTFGKISGSIRILDPIWKNNKTYGLKLIDYTVGGPPKINLVNPQIINWNRSNDDRESCQSAITIVSEEREGNNIGNIEISGAYFKIDNAVNKEKYNIFTINNATKGINDVSIIDVKNVLNVSGKIKKYRNVKIQDRNLKLTVQP